MMSAASNIANKSQVIGINADGSASFCLTGSATTIGTGGIDAVGVITASQFQLTDGTVVGGGGFTTSRATVSGTTASLGVGATATLDIDGFNSYALLKVGISSAAWVRLYTDDVSRTNDAARSFDTDPTPGSGVIAEVRTTTTGISTFRMSPGVIGYNDAVSIGSTIFARVTNNETQAATIQVDLTIINLEP